MSFLTAIFYPTRLWDGSSKSRTTADGPIGGIHRKPDAEDYAQMLQETIALQTQLGLPFQIVAHASTIAWDPTLGLTTKIAATGNETINAASVGPPANARPSSSPRRMRPLARSPSAPTSPSARRSSAAPQLTASITFVSDGTKWIEVGRLVYA
jgi:hypothetical protein